MARGKGTDGVSLRTAEERAAREAIKKVHERSQAMYQRVLQEYNHDRLALPSGIKLTQPEYLDVADKELDSILYEAFVDDKYEYIRSLLRQYSRTEQVPDTLLLLDDYDLVRGQEWAESSGVPLMIGLRTWAQAGKYLPSDKERYSLEREYCAPSEHGNGAGYTAQTLQELVATTILQRGSLDGEDAPGYSVKPLRAIRFDLQGMAPYRHLTELGDNDIIYVRGGRLENPKPSHAVKYGYLYLERDTVKGIGYGPYQPPQTNTTIPEGSRLTIHQARRYLDPFTVIHLTGVMAQ
jgi:hypothetical protein